MEKIGLIRSLYDRKKYKQLMLKGKAQLSFFSFLATYECWQLID